MTDAKEQMDYRQKYLALLYSHLELTQKYNEKCKEYSKLFCAMIEQKRKLKNRVKA